MSAGGAEAAAADCADAATEVLRMVVAVVVILPRMCFCHRRH